MNVLINGAGVSGMILCDVLRTMHPEWNISVQGNKSKIGSYPLLLDLDQITFQPDAFSNLKKRTIKVGFTNDGLKTIVEEPTDEMLEMYYKKQGRKKTSSSMSNSKKSFKAIDLRDWYEYSWKRNKDLVHKVQTGQYDLIFETKLDFDHVGWKSETEYIVMKDFDLKGFEYVYDCSEMSVKRYNKNCVEMLTKVDDAIRVQNFYGEPKIFTSYDVKTKCETIYASRNATKSQLKVVDVLNYINERWPK